jgi:ATP-dependent RNA helicase RhlE
MQPDPNQSVHSFRALGVPDRLAELLDRRNITEPTPIQHQAIPALMQGKDIIGIAQTGTGKTLAFGLPMLNKLANGPGRGLVVVPTRELAYQVEESLTQLAAAVGIRMVTFVGGASMELQKRQLKQNPRILVATPGRLNDHLRQRTVTLREVNTLVLDEADQMLDMGFKPQIEDILAHVPKERQTMLFSATMPREILELASKYMQLPLRIEVAPAGTAADKVEQELIIVQKQDKLALLKSILAEHTGPILVFSRTKHGAKKMAVAVRAMGHAAAEIHANRSLPQRREALAGFKSGKYKVLIATDIAARGIHVTGIEVVINFDLPDDAGDYVHRIGRTARAGKEGKAISFATPDQMTDIRDIERLIRMPIKRRPLPAHLPVPFVHSAPPAGHGPSSGRGGRPQGGFRRGGYSSHRGSSGGRGRR